MARATDWPHKKSFGHGRYNLLKVETRGRFEGHVHMTQAACRSTSTINQSSKSDFTRAHDLDAR
jgi:hypothetical protein